MTDLYLILHKVRGEPAFDIACQLPIGEEEGWIVPTSGHRAYPFYTWLLNSFNNVIECSEVQGAIGWDEIPDHYQPNSSPKESKADGDTLLASLGLPTKVHSALSGKLTRRV